MRGDGRASWDLSAIRNFPLTEKVAMQFRAEVYNAWNHPNFRDPDLSPTSSTFGQVFNTTSDPRQWQFSLNVKF